MRVIGLPSLCAAVLVLVWLVPAGAGGKETGISLLGACTWSEDKLEPMKAFDAGYCTGYFDGMLDTYQGPARWCLPTGGLSRIDMIHAVSDWIRSRPDKLRVEASALIWIALADLYPCSPK